MKDPPTLRERGGSVAWIVGIETNNIKRFLLCVCERVNRQNGLLVFPIVLGGMLFLCEAQFNKE